MGKWLPVPGTPGAYIRRTSDGQYEGRRVGSVRKSIEKNKRLQQAAKEKPSFTDTNGELGQMIASYPEAISRDIHAECGTDPEKQDCWLRDHPQWCTVPRNQIPAPPKRLTFLVGARVSPEEWTRIFPKSRGT